jgi:hypothetical protein
VVNDPLSIVSEIFSALSSLSSKFEMSLILFFYMKPC